MGCGPGVYVPQDQVEREVLTGLCEVLGFCSDPKRFTHQVNEELRRIWETTPGYDPAARRKLESVEAKIANIRRALEEGLHDAHWANRRLQELQVEREALNSAAPPSEPPQIDADAAVAYRAQTQKILAHTSMLERKQMLRSCVDG